MSSSSHSSFSFGRLLLVAALSGFIALSWEILWARLYNFASGSKATAFGAMLGSYLLGLALGSLWSIRHQKAESDSLRSLSRLILSASLLSFLVVPLASWLITVGRGDGWVAWDGNPFYILAWPLSLPLVVLASAIQGATLPLICHVGIPADQRAGARLSYVYLANIIGSGLGSLLTGFLLLEWMRLQDVAMLLGALSIVLVMFISIKNALQDKVSALVGGILALAVVCSPLLHRGLWERLFYKGDWKANPPFAMIVESRHGVVTVDSGRHVAGNGAYDGVINTKLPPGDYHVRPYFISAVHPGPIKHVLVVGMSAGAWTQIVSSHPDQPKVDVVEICHSYTKVIAAYPEVSSILTNPRVTINIDDGRRWLKRHPDNKYDCILMNTTHHWREFSSALLSREFLVLAKAHLKPGGIVMWNCTDSGRAAKTGMDVFPHTMMCLNNCVASDSPLEMNKERWRSVLERYQINGKPLYDLSSEKDRADLEKVLTLVDREFDPMPEEAEFRWWHVKRAGMERLWGHEKPITDDNLGHEY
jgi:hypothetical protein